MEALEFQVSELADGTLLKLTGQLTLAEIPAFETLVAQVMAPGTARLIIDMSDLQILSSAGLGELLKLHRRASAQRCALHLASLPQNIETTIRAARLDSIFKISPTISDATA